MRNNDGFRPNQLGPRLYSFYQVDNCRAPKRRISLGKGTLAQGLRLGKAALANAKHRCTIQAYPGDDQNGALRLWPCNGVWMPV